MRYTLLIYTNSEGFSEMTPEQMQESQAAFGAYIGSLKEAGVFVETDWLSPANTATTITLVGGERRVQDGPYADSKETLGGYFVIEVPDLDEALSWAEKSPAVHFGKVEVRASAIPSG